MNTIFPCFWERHLPGTDKYCYNVNKLNCNQCFNNGHSPDLTCGSKFMKHVDLVTQ